MLNGAQHFKEVGRIIVRPLISKSVGAYLVGAYAAHQSIAQGLGLFEDLLLHVVLIGPLAQELGVDLNALHWTIDQHLIAIAQHDVVTPNDAAIALF